MSDKGFNLNTPIELPPEEYSVDYMQRFINQLRLNFLQIKSPNDVRSTQEAFDWYIA
tara:strand:+ start:562 stop:732 length:171 start_codon:yes stop_codon:yes gene_type:complete